MPRYNGDTIPCCLECESEHELKTKVCKKCGVIYCAHYASVTDVRYCGNCISDFAIKETIMEKVVEHERPDGTVTFSRKYQARHIMLRGTDWLFNATIIPDMTDAELEATIEYHRANVSLMLDERTSRQQERFKKLSGIKIVHVKHESQIDREKREEKEAAKANKAATKKSKTKDITIDMMQAMLQQLAKSGLTIEQITALAGKGKK